jgi:hypothetical protein
MGWLTWGPHKRTGDRVGSGDGRSKELVDTRRNELRTRERWKRNGCRYISERRQIESRRRIDALTLARTQVTAIMVSRGRMFVATLGRVSAMRGIMHWAIGMGRGAGN